jgi:Helix-turn-helix domain
MTPPPRPASPAIVEAEYLTPVDVATLLQVSVKSVYRWVAEDASLPAVWLGRSGGPRRHGGTLRFPRQALLRWLQSKEQGRPRLRLRKPLSSDAELRVNPRNSQGRPRAVGPSVGPLVANGAAERVPSDG